MLRQYDPFLGLFEDWRPFRNGNGHALLRPPIDVFEDESRMHVTVELAGLRPEDVSIEVKANVLTVSAERRLEHADARGGYHRIERRYGRLARTFTLPETIDTSGIEATLSDGLLRLALPKRAEAQPRKIEIQTQKPSRNDAVQVEAQATA